MDKELVLQEEDTSDGPSQTFFRLSHWGRLLFMGLLAAVFLGTSGQAIWQLAQPEMRTSGFVVEVVEARSSARSAAYTLVLENEQGEIDQVRLRNNGRILKYLLAQEDVDGIPLTVVYRQDVAIAMDALDSSERTIRESRIPPWVQLLIGFFPLLILLFHYSSDLIEERSV